MARRGGGKRKDDFIDDSDSGAEAPRKKPSRKEPQEEEDSPDGGITVCELSKTRKVIVRKFKAMVLVDIREYWSDKDGNTKPSRKGISLSVEQWKMLRDHVRNVDDALDELS